MLAAATFAAVRSSNRTARIAEQSLLSGMRPLLLPSLTDDPVHKLLWSDRHVARLAGAGAIVEEENDVIYLAMSLRNVGSGIALLHGWFPRPGLSLNDVPHAEPAEFRRLTIDLYVAAGGTGYWEGAIRQPDDPAREFLRACIAERSPITIDVLYSDENGGQRRISRFTILPGAEDSWYCQGGRHWNLDLPDPR